MKRIILVDDDTLFLEVLEKELAGHAEVTCFSNTQELLEHARSEEFSADAVYIDLNVTDIAGVVWPLGGLTAMQAVQNHLGDKAPNFSIISGLDPLIYTETCLAHGAEEFIEKASDHREMARLITENFMKKAG